MSALNGIRVVELAESVAGEYCGKLLADFGADVIKVEPPGWGCPTRAMAPHVGEVGGTERSQVFAYLNTNKRSAVFDVTRDRKTLHDILASADAVIDDHVRVPDLASRHPDVVFCAITPFGQGAPADLQNAKSINVFHASGWGYHTPSHPDPAKPPLKGPGRFLADYEAGLDAALCVASSLFARLHHGDGEFIDLSAQAVLVSRADCILGRFITGEIAPENTRDDYDQQGPASFFACRDGHVYLYMTSRSHWVQLKQLMDHPPWLDEFDDDWLEFSVTPEKVETFHRGFAAWVKRQTKNAVADTAQRLGVPLVPVNGAADLRRSAQYRHRGFFRDVAHPVLGTAAYPTVPYRMSRSPVEITCPAPALGQHTAEVLTEIRPPRTRLSVKSPQLKPPKASRGGPLEGVRVVELTKVWAGPYAGKLLAFLGAEVIKVENAATPEEMRAYGGTDINHAPFFLSINPEILSVDLDIKTPAGLDRLRDLIGRSDIVINNLRPGAMERQGLSYDAPQGHQVRHHLGLDQDVGQRRTARLSDRLRAMLRRTGGPRIAGRLPGRSAARREHALRGLHGRRRLGLRRRRGAAASRTHRRRPIRRRVGGRGAVVDDRRLLLEQDLDRAEISGPTVTGIQTCAPMAAIRVRAATGSRSPSPTTRNGIGCATLWAQACSPTTRGTRHLRGGS